MHNIQKLNRAWMYEKEKEQWVGFECHECITLEIQYQSFEHEMDIDKKTMCERVDLGTHYVNLTTMVRENLPIFD